MTCYSIQPKNRTFIKGCGHMSFAKSMGKILIKL